MKFENAYKYVIGIDVSQKTLDICRYEKSSGQISISQLSNTLSKIKSYLDKVSKLLLSQALSKSDILFVLEPTGTYSDKILMTLCSEDYKVSLVQPKQSDGFHRAMSWMNKTDIQAAKALAIMGSQLNLPLYKKPEDTMLKRKEISHALNALKTQRQQTTNRLHALAQKVLRVPMVTKVYEELVEQLDKQIEQLEKELQSLDDDDFEDEFKLISSVTGLGEKTTRLILIAAGSLKNFKRADQVVKFFGLVPSTHRSDSSVNKRGKITKRGNAQVRASLYMAANSAIQYNPDCKELFERLRKKGKPYKVAKIAVMNKLIRQAFGVVRSGTKFSKEFYLKYKETKTA